MGSGLTQRPRLQRLRHWIVAAPPGTVRREFAFAVVLSRLAVNPAARLKIFLVSMLMRAHDRLPGIRRVGTWFTIRYRGGRYRLYLARRSELEVLQEVLCFGAYDFPELPAPRTILDLGSHIGTSLLHFRATYPNARIIGVEPDPDTFRRLSKNAAQLGVEVHQLAIAPIDGPIDFYPQWAAALSSTRRPRPSARPIVVKGRTLDTLRRELGLSKLDLLKIDIEGGETSALSGALDVPVMIGEFHDERDVVAQGKFLSLFDDFDLRIFEQGPSPHPTFVAVKQNSSPRSPGRPTEEE